VASSYDQLGDSEKSSIPLVIYCATLVANQTTHYLQALRSGLQVPPRHGPTMPVRVSCADIVASQSSTAALVFNKFTPRGTHWHMLWRQEHRCSQSGSI